MPKKTKETEEKIKETASEEQEVKEEKIEEEKEETNEYYDKFVRLAAEFDNYKKRTLKEKEQTYQNALSDTILEILPVYDNLDRAINSLDDNCKEYKEGIVLVKKQFEDILKKMSVEKIVSVGETFDPLYHNAVMHIDDDEVGENIIVEEFLPGFKYKDRVIRHSMVKVAN